MPNRRFMSAFMVLVLASVACSVNLSDTPAPGFSDSTSTPALQVELSPTVAPVLTLEQLKNAEVEIVGVSGTAATRKIKLTDGRFQAGSDLAAADYVSVSMGEQVAFGDLNGDGAEDAAIIIGENYGGTGRFVLVVAMLGPGGQTIFFVFVGVEERHSTHTVVSSSCE